MFFRKKKVTSPESVIQKHRVHLSQKLDTQYHSQVRYGPFQGLKLSANSWWGAADRGSMLLGLYEQEILNSLSQIKRPNSVFIDIGAADGYYGIGVLINKLFRKSYCFEISARGRAVILENAQLNQVSSQVIVEGAADSNFPLKVPSQDLKDSVVLIDIEGAEFDILNRSVFEALKSSIIFIELHDWFFEDGHEKLAQLKREASYMHSLSELKTGSRDLSRFEELRTWSDTDRWLLCSEGRAQRMTWLRLDPLDG